MRDQRNQRHQSLTGKQIDTRKQADTQFWKIYLVFILLQKKVSFLFSANFSIPCFKSCSESTTFWPGKSFKVFCRFFWVIFEILLNTFTNMGTREFQHPLGNRKWVDPGFFPEYRNVTLERNWFFFWTTRPTLKSCSFPLHRQSELKKSHELPLGRNFFLQYLCLKRYTMKRSKKISS